MRREHLILLLILCLALLLRVHNLGSSCFWQDEMCSVEASTGRGLAHVDLPTGVIIEHPPLLTTLNDAKPWWTIWTSLHNDNHPPLYFVLLRWWRDLFGEGDVAARAMSIVPSLVSVALIYFALRPISSCCTALLAAGLMAVAMPQIHFAQEARGYSLLVAFVLCAAVSLIRIENLGASPRRLIALAASCIAMMLTHYFAIASIAAITVYALLALRGKTRTRTILTIVIAALIYTAIWAPWLLQQRASVNINNAWQIEPVAGHLSLTLNRLAILPIRFITERFNFFTWLAVVGILIYAALFYITARIRSHSNLLWLLLFLFPILMVFSIDLLRHSRHLEMIRYTLAASPGLYAILAQRKWLVIPAIAVAAFTVPGAYSHDQSWRLLALDLQQHVQPNDMIIYTSAGRDDWYAGELYLGVSHYAPNIPAPIIILDNHSSLPPIHPGTHLWIVAGTENVHLPNISIQNQSKVPNVGALLTATAQ